jgi:hypothetical protein
VSPVYHLANLDNWNTDLVLSVSDFCTALLIRVSAPLPHPGYLSLGLFCLSGCSLIFLIRTVRPSDPLAHLSCLAIFLIRITRRLLMRVTRSSGSFAYPDDPAVSLIRASLSELLDCWFPCLSGSSAACRCYFFKATMRC